MQTFQPYEYLFIAIANAYGLDKAEYSTRINWVKENINNLENIQADETFIYQKQVRALRIAQSKQPVHSVIHFDAVCSGIQVLSALTGCHKGGKATGLINTGKRPDAYTEITKVMEDILGDKLDMTTKELRSCTKEATITAVYGSTNKPKEIFGQGAKLQSFKKGCKTIAPAAFGMLEILRNSWNAGALSHNWILPDGFNVHAPVVVPKKARLEIDELNGHKVSAQFRVNEGTDEGLSNIANVTHSVDGYILRSMIRYCNYGKATAIRVKGLIDAALAIRAEGAAQLKPNKLMNRLSRANHFKLADIRMINYINVRNVGELDTWILESLQADLTKMLSYEPFELVVIHDSFGCLPSNMNEVRYWYNEVLAKLAESDTMQYLLQQLYRNPELEFIKESEDLANYIRQADYTLC